MPWSRVWYPMDIIQMRRLILVLLFGVIRAAGAGMSPDMQLAAKTMAEMARVCEANGMLLWRKSLCGPLVLVNPSTRAAIANRPDPEGKFRQEGDVYLGAFPENFTPANTSITWNGQAWATIMLPLPVDPFLRLRLIAHESFHRIQREVGLSASDMPSAHLDTEEGRIWLRLELRALGRALRLNSEAGRQSAADAMLFRLYRHQLFPGSAAAEAAMEKQEGLAEYTGAFIALRATGEDIGRQARQIEGREESDAFARSFAYATGPALGLLLDRYATGWRARASTQSLDSMLTSAVRLGTPRDLKSQAQRRAGDYGYPAVAAAEHERDERHQSLLLELTSKFLDGPTLDFPHAGDLRRNFNPGNLVPFPPHGTYYPNGTFAADWGKLQLDSGGAVLAPDNLSMKVAAPADPAARPLRGDGWTLVLSPGWTIRPGTRPGSLTLVPPDAK